MSKLCSKSKEYVKEYNRTYHLRNKEEINAKHREYKLKNKAALKLKRQLNRGQTNSYTAKRRAKKKNATPSWSNTKAIAKFYSECPEGYHVDHIVPLQGKNVRGLHILINLQYLSANDNYIKGNRHESDR